MMVEQQTADLAATDTPPLVDLNADYEASGVAEVLRELIGLRPVTQRIRETAAVLLVDRARRGMGLSQTAPSLHMRFPAIPGPERQPLS